MSVHLLPPAFYLPGCQQLDLWRHPAGPLAKWNPFKKTGHVCPKMTQPWSEEEGHDLSSWSPVLLPVQEVPLLQVTPALKPGVVTVISMTQA